ncbi:MAG: hypothetical protein HY589_00025 [Candidatus Omnitrophica bacterium]|nr:hypothetical protein [Candidatus Omnitrophota bacterium]
MRKKIFVCCSLIFVIMFSAIGFGWSLGNKAQSPSGTLLQDDMTAEEKAEEEKLRQALKKFVPPPVMKPVIPPKRTIDLPNLQPNIPKLTPDFAKPPQPLSPFKKGPIIRKKPKKEEKKTLDELEERIEEEAEQSSDEDVSE